MHKYYLPGIAYYFCGNPESQWDMTLVSILGPDFSDDRRLMCIDPDGDKFSIAKQRLYGVLTGDKIVRRESRDNYSEIFEVGIPQNDLRDETYIYTNKDRTGYCIPSKHESDCYNLHDLREARCSTPETVEKYPDIWLKPWAWRNGEEYVGPCVPFERSRGPWDFSDLKFG